MDRAARLTTCCADDRQCGMSKTTSGKSGLSPERRACIEAMNILSGRLGRAPTPNEVAKHLGITRTPAREMMIALHAEGLCNQPRVIYEGDWSLTRAGKKIARELD